MHLQIHNVSRYFNGRAAVNNVSIDVTKPQMIGVIGRSGAGKSTMLRAINRLTEANEGRILFEGTDVLSLKGARKRRWQRDCAMIFQQFNLVPRLSVMTNVLLGRLNHNNAVTNLFGLFSDAERRMAVDVLQRLEIVEHAMKRADELSGGQQQRVAIARALMQQPRMILADEPIASLDPRSATKVMETLRQINKQDGLTVICNLHTLDTARSYCDRIIGMRDGVKVFDGLAAELTHEAALEIYGAEALEEAVTSTSLKVSAPVEQPSQAQMSSIGVSNLQLA